MDAHNGQRWGSHPVMGCFSDLATHGEAQESIDLSFERPSALLQLGEEQSSLEHREESDGQIVGIGAGRQLPVGVKGSESVADGDARPGQSETGKGPPQLVEEGRAIADCRGVGWIEPVDQPDESLGRELDGDNSHLRADDWPTRERTLTRWP